MPEPQIEGRRVMKACVCFAISAAIFAGCLIVPTVTGNEPLIGPDVVTNVWLILASPVLAVILGYGVGLLTGRIPESIGMCLCAGLVMDVVLGLGLL